MTFEIFTRVRLLVFLVISGTVFAASTPNVQMISNDEHAAWIELQEVVNLPKPPENPTGEFVKQQETLALAAARPMGPIRSCQGNPCCVACCG